MKRKFLEDLGLEADVVEKIMAEAGKDTTALKAKIDDLSEQINVKEATLKEKNSKLAEFEKLDMDSIKKEQFELGKKEGSKEIEEFKKQNSLEKALLNYKAKDTSILSKMLDMKKIKFNDKFEIEGGLDEQIKAFKESHDYLFEPDKQPPKFGDKTPGNSNLEIKKEDFKKMSYRERVALKKEQPDLYESLKNN